MFQLSPYIYSILLFFCVLILHSPLCWIEFLVIRSTMPALWLSILYSSSPEVIYICREKLFFQTVKQTSVSQSMHIIEWIISLETLYQGGPLKSWNSQHTILQTILSINFNWLSTNKNCCQSRGAHTAIYEVFMSQVMSSTTFWREIFGFGGEG